MTDEETRGQRGGGIVPMSAILCGIVPVPAIECVSEKDERVAKLCDCHFVICFGNCGLLMKIG